MRPLPLVPRTASVGPEARVDCVDIMVCIAVKVRRAVVALCIHLALAALALKAAA